MYIPMFMENVFLDENIHFIDLHVSKRRMLDIIYKPVLKGENVKIKTDDKLKQLQTWRKRL